MSKKVRKIVVAVAGVLAVSGVIIALAARKSKAK